MRGPALAVIGIDGQLERSTAAFSSRGDADVLLAQGSPDLERVLSGETSSAVLKSGGLTAAVEAIVDSAGCRHAVLTLRTPAAEADPPDSENPLLEEDLDSSPAVIFLKDLEGRYLRVNAAHGRLIGGGEAQLLGHSDAELEPRLTVDGPRLAQHDPAVVEPLQFEYIVPAFEQRPALSVLRFAVHDGEGNTVAVCGVAAPQSQAELARAEAERLMEVERIAHLDPSEARTELLTQWGLLTPTRSVAGAAPANGSDGAEEDPVAGSDGDAHVALNAILAEERRRANELADALATAQSRLDTVAPDADEAQLRAEQARVLAEQAQAESEHLRGEVELARTEVEQARAVARREHEEADAARAATQAARGEAAQALLRIEQLQAESAGLSSHLEQAEAEAREWRLQAEHAEVEAVQAKARAEQAEAEARTARARAEEAATSARQADGRADQAELSVRQATTRAEQAETQARAAKAEVEQSEAEARKARARAEQAEAEARQARLEAAELQSAGRQAALELEELRGAERQARLQIEQLEAAARQARLQMDELEGVAARALARAEEAEAGAREWRQRAERAESELATLRSATSTATASTETADRAAAEAAADADRTALAELRAALAAEQARTDELRRTVADAQTRLADLAREDDPGRAGKREAADNPEREHAVAAARLEAETARAELASAESKADAARAQADSARAQAESARAQADAAAAQLAATRAQVEAAQAQAETIRLALDASRRDAEAARENAELARQDAAAVREELAVARQELLAAQEATEAARRASSLKATRQGEPAGEGTGLRWTAGGQRELARALGDAEDLRSGFARATRTLVERGGWDLAAVWLPDPRGVLRCASVSSEELLGELAERALGAALPVRDSGHGSALYAREPGWLTEAPAALVAAAEAPGDAGRTVDRLVEAFGAGVGTAVLLPVRSGVARVGLLELLAVDGFERDDSLVCALEAVGLQLGQFVALARARGGRH